MAFNLHPGGVYAQLQSQQASALMAQQQLLQQHREVEYFYVYVSESEISKVGHWIVLEPDKTLSLENLRHHYATCFGIKYKCLNVRNEIETRYIRYHNGFFRFPPGLDLNNTRFVAYYFTDAEDVQAFMDMAEANDNGVGTVPVLEFKTRLIPESNNSTILGQTATNFDMEQILLRGAQSTPKSDPNKLSALENVSSTSDVILNEPTVEVISVHNSQSAIQRLPPPPPGPPTSQTPTPVKEINNPPIAVPGPSGVKVKQLGPSVSSTSDVEPEKNMSSEKNKHKPITFNDSSGFRREHSSVMVKVNVAPKAKNMLHRYQSTRPRPQNVNEKTPLKITLKRRPKQEEVTDRAPLKITLETRGRQTQRDMKILKIEDEKGRTTALLTKKKWAGKSNVEGQKRRSEPDEEFGPERYKRRRYETHQQQYYHQTESKPVYDEYYYRTLNVLLVGFHTNAPVIHETTTYFSEFGVVTNLQLYTMDNRHNLPEYYAYMKIRTDDAISLFSDRHLYNGTIIYAVRVDGTSLPSRLSCKVCGYQGINVGYLHYHFEGQYHQFHLQKRLESLSGTVANVYRDSYYRITYDELYVQYPNNTIQELVRNDYWKRPRNPSTYSSAVVAPTNRYYNNERERYY